MLQFVVRVRSATRCVSGMSANGRVKFDCFEFSSRVAKTNSLFNTHRRWLTFSHSSLYSGLMESLALSVSDEARFVNNVSLGLLLFDSSNILFHPLNLSFDLSA